MTEYGATSVRIKERMPKGKFAGGAISFKIEAASTAAYVGQIRRNQA